MQQKALMQRYNFAVLFVYNQPQPDINVMPMQTPKQAILAVF
jgi:hypothetical protein